MDQLGDTLDELVNENGPPPMVHAHLALPACES